VCHSQFEFHSAIRGEQGRDLVQESEHVWLLVFPKGISTNHLLVKKDDTVMDEFEERSRSELVSLSSDGAVSSAWFRKYCVY